VPFLIRLEAISEEPALANSVVAAGDCQVHLTEVLVPRYEAPQPIEATGLGNPHFDPALMIAPLRWW
jgi:hypothetical protein